MGGSGIRLLRWRHLFLPVLQRQPGLQAIQTLSQHISLLLELPGSGGEPRIRLPPVDTDLLSLIDRRDKEANLERQDVYRRQRERNVTRNHDPFIEDSLQEVGKVG